MLLLNVKPSFPNHFQEVVDSLEGSSLPFDVHGQGKELEPPTNAPLNGDRQDEVENCLVDHDRFQTVMYSEGYSDESMVGDLRSTNVNLLAANPFEE